MNAKISALVGGFVFALLAIAWLRLQAGSEGIAGTLSSYATLVYVGASVLAAVYFMRAGI
ncbi:MAG: hypothetical protein HKN43_14295, partial [Rhodothermales bacterium]|nr:hypothetical protein [Rhodothermales bacterium]